MTPRPPTTRPLLPPAVVAGLALRTDPRAGRRLRSRREALGLTVDQVAAAADVSPWVVERIERCGPERGSAFAPRIDAALCRLSRC